MKSRTKTYPLLNIFKKIFLVFIFISPVSLANNVLNFSQVTAANPEDCAIKTLTKAYKNLNINIEFPLFPSQRSLIESNKGNTDGETARIENINERYPNLVRIPVAICHMKIHLYSIKTLDIHSYEDLTKYRLGHRQGFLAVEQMFQHLSPYKVTSTQQLLNMLLNNRIDIISLSKTAASSLAKKHPSIKLKQVDIDVPPVKLYHYLHKKHQKIIPLITQELQRLEESGFIKNAIARHQMLFTQ